MNMVAIQKDTGLNRFILKETIQHSRPILENLIRMTRRVENHYCENEDGHKERLDLIKKYQDMMIQRINHPPNK